ncbi:hypothetical protein EPO05_06880 [Patescibacteria group bacterium]|nr:MAG: hypothetical protein EPO05_06880 [Patescibacteria group bacterium]
MSAEMLSALLAMYLKGQQRPDALFSDSVLDYVKQAYILNNSSRANKPALHVAADKLMLSLEQDYEPELQRLYGAMADVGELLSDGFVAFCEEIILPVWIATHED